ncbi:MAG: UDP-N-acetylmuramoyl-tripeptide--D-alanyl-D-alanine ligase, partial [Clostridia bacterium]|nr:UDP-N-acetylmuramoyl-tripeptide--D-alanyl-D-alanine ligase [Clostridia bacterium]
MIVIYFVFCAFCAFAAVLSALRYVHYLQLNSYRNRTQLSWMKTHRERLACLIPVFFALCFAPIGQIWSSIVSAVFTAFSCYTIFPRKAKKPLVITSRVKRLLATYLILFLGTGAGGWFLGVSFRMTLPLLFLLLSPFAVLLANLINQPAEKAARNWFIRDAKRILRSCPDLCILGVTGSYGKTSVKSFLGQLLSVRFDTLITPESYNTPMGVVRTVRERLLPKHSVFVCEMGARHVGDIRELCDLVHPRHGIITSVGNQHLETFLTPENILHTKFELADALPPDGLLFLNGDSEPIRKHMAEIDRPFISYGTTPDSHYYASDISVSVTGTSFVLHTPDGKTCAYRMKLIGGHNVLNVTGALAVCISFGIQPEELIPAVRRLEPVSHRMQLLPGPDLSFIDDAFNSNPAGAKAA